MKLNLATLVVLALVLVLPHLLGVPWTPLRIAGAALAAASLVLLVVARLQLGRAFSVQAKASQLVTSGIYAKIRNPIYVFSSLAIAGFLLWANQPLALLVFVVIVPMQVVRARREAAVLEACFGDAYREYKRKTWF